MAQDKLARSRLQRAQKNTPRDNASSPWGQSNDDKPSESVSAKVYPAAFFAASNFRRARESGGAWAGAFRIGGMKLTIRDLLWLALVAAVVFAWINSDRKRAAELQDVQLRFEKWRAEWAAETNETLRLNRIAALNPGAYQDWLKLKDEERRKARQLLAEKLGTADQQP